MREIKFRGYNKDNKKWLESMTIMKNNEKYYMVVEEMHAEWRHIKPTLPVEEASIGQYTGFKDKNGVEIYEGDIIKIDKNDKEHFYIQWGYGEWRAVSNCVEYAGSLTDRFASIKDYCLNVEVIGNIYEERLKDGN